MKRLVLSSLVGASITASLGLANYVAMRSGSVRLGNALFKVILWSWPMFGAFFDVVAPTEHSKFSPHPWGGYAALLFNVVLFSLISYAALRFVSRSVQELK
jgi:hypothetical protein